MSSPSQPPCKTCPVCAYNRESDKIVTLKPDPHSPIQLSDHLEGDGNRFFKAAAELGLEGIVSFMASCSLPGADPWKASGGRRPGDRW